MGHSQDAPVFERAAHACQKKGSLFLLLTLTFCARSLEGKNAGSYATRRKAGGLGLQPRPCSGSQVQAQGRSRHSSQGPWSGLSQTGWTVLPVELSGPSFTHRGHSPLCLLSSLLSLKKASPETQGQLPIVPGGETLGGTSSMHSSPRALLCAARGPQPQPCPAHAQRCVLALMLPNPGTENLRLGGSGILRKDSPCCVPQFLLCHRQPRPVPHWRLGECEGDQNDVFLGVRSG